MKKELLTILCMTLVCASVMLGIMGIYKITGAQYQNKISSAHGLQNNAFKIQTFHKIV